MPVVSMFDTALCHIKMSDYDLLQKMANDIFNGKETEFRVHATEHTIVIYMVWAWPRARNPDAQQRSWVEERVSEGFSREFCELLLAAAEHECWILQLDQDAEEDEGFTMFDGDEPVITFPLRRLERIMSTAPGKHRNPEQPRSKW
ncbi:MAG: hypothetical protein AAGJ29_12300 [Pseudomonadota bacterium]